MASPKILHIAPFNTANVPFTFVEAERKLGFESRLITLGKSHFEFNEDICLDLPFITTPGIASVKRLVSDPSRLDIRNVHKIPDQIPIEWRSKGIVETLFIKFRESIWRRKIDNSLSEIDIDSFDIIQLDGGLGFYRDGRIIKNLKMRGKKIICCYTGSDLRTRGVIPEIDEIADLNVTVEFDLIYFHPEIHHVFFPFDISRFEIVKQESRKTVRIGHAPTNRRAKGSDEILARLNRLKDSFKIEIVLIENLPYEEAIHLKSTCNIFIDQIGDLGYGINSLEAMAMGIPTASSLVKGFDDKYSDHSFIEINESTIEEKLKPFIEDGQLRRQVGLQSREWVKKYHNPEKVVREIQLLAGI